MSNNGDDGGGGGSSTEFSQVPNRLIYKHPPKNDYPSSKNWQGKE